LFASAPGLPGGVIASDGEFLLKITFPVIQTDKQLPSCGFHVSFSIIVTEYINNSGAAVSVLDLWQKEA
jgi:hypothetical protein